MSTLWTKEASDALARLVTSNLYSYRDVATRLNEEFGTSYTRNACIGRAKRLGLVHSSVAFRPDELPPEERALRRARRQEKHNQRRRERRERQRAAGIAPSKVTIRTKKGVRAMVAAMGISKTSPGYRKHLPPLPEMSKTELRNMLAGAVRNTAAMELSQ